MMQQPILALCSQVLLLILLDQKHLCASFQFPRTLGSCGGWGKTHLGATSQSSLSASKYTYPIPSTSLGQRSPVAYASETKIDEKISFGESPPTIQMATLSGPRIAPLVDSDLLRFLSSQKVNKRPKKSSSTVDYDSEEPVLQSTKEREQSEYQKRIIYSIVPLNPSSTYLDALGFDQSSWQIDEATSPFQKQSRRKASSLSTEDALVVRSKEERMWLSSFNASQIAQCLVSIGGEEEVAIEAGEVVQKLALSRSTRQHIKRFLRDRDALWTKDSHDSSSPSTAPKMGGSPRMTEQGTKTDETSDFEDMRQNVNDVLEYLVEVGLTGRDIATILTHTPSVSMMKARREGKEILNGETLEDTVTRAFGGVLIETLQLRRYDARKVLRTCPGLLTKRGSTGAEEVISLLSSLGVSASSLARDKVSLPMLLSRSAAALFRFVCFLSSDAVRMPVEKIGPLIRRSDCAELLDAVAPLPRQTSSPFGYDMNLDNSTMGENAREIINDIQRHRGDTANIVDENYNKMAATARVLRRYVGLGDLGTILSSNPNILLMDVASEILPVVAFLREEVKIPEEDIPKIFHSYPTLLGYSVTEMRKVVDFMLSLEVSKDMFGIIFRAFPSMLTLDVDSTMVPVVEFLREIGVTNMGRFVTRLPPVLSYSVEQELKPKWEYLTEDLNFDAFEIMRFPAYFSYPLEKVIITRYEYLRNVKRIPIRLVSIDDVLRFGDIDFATKIAGDKDDGSTFLAFVKERNERSGKSKRSAHPTGKNKKRRRRRPRIDTN